MKKHALRALRVVVSLGLLVWLAYTIDLRDLYRKLETANPMWLVVAFGINSFGNLLGAWRWQLLLRSQGRQAKIPFLFGSYLVGLFYNNFLPSTIGGDVVRAASAKRKGGGSLTEHLTVVLVERLIGLLATLTLGGIAALAGAADALDPRVSGALFLALGAALVGLVVALSRRIRGMVLTHLERLPIRFLRNTLGKMLAAFELFSRARGTLLANYVLSLGFQFLLILHFYVIQFAFGESLPISTFIVVVPLVFCVMLLPLGINGLGVRESAFKELLGSAGMDPATAVALSLASYAIAVGQGVLGAFVHFTREVRDGREDTSETTEAEPTP